MKQHVAIVYSLPSSRLLATKYGATDEDTHEIMKMVGRALKARGYTCSTHPIAESNIEKIKEIKANCIFNLIEWCGLDIELAHKAFKYLRESKIPVTGSSEKLFVLTGDKGLLKQELLKIGIPTPNALVVGSDTHLIDSNLQYPVIVKPTLEHCSIGLTEKAIVENEHDLADVVKRQIEEFEQDVLVEDYVVGRELLVYLIETAEGVRILPIEEVTFPKDKKYKFQTYETKWVEGHPDYDNTDVVLAELTDLEKKEIETVCQRAFIELGFRGYARFDLRLRGGVPYILETNANPSVYDATEEIESIEDEVIWGIKFPDYIKLIVEAAFRSYKNHQTI